MRKLWVLLTVLFLPALAGATVSGTASTVAFTCTSSTGPFPFTFPVLNTGALQVIDQAAGALPGVMTVLASNQWTATPVNGSYANGGSVTLVTACATGDTLTIARTTETTQLTAFTPFMPALYANFENRLDQLSTGSQDSYRLSQVHVGNVTGSGVASVLATPLGQYLNLAFPDGSGCATTGPVNAILTTITTGCAGSGATADVPGNISARTVSQLSDPPGGSATALRDATQHYVDTSLMINLTSDGCSPTLADNAPCFAQMAANLTFNRYFLPGGIYKVLSCTAFSQALPQYFEISGAAWGASKIVYDGPASANTPINTTGWWTSGQTTINATVAPRVGDQVLASQDAAGLVHVNGIQPGTKVTAVSGAGPFVATISLPTTASAGSAGSPVPVSFGWQCIFSIGGDDTNWFTIKDLGFGYTNLPQAPTDSRVDYPATAILFNTSGFQANGIHDFSMRNLYFASGSRGIAATQNTVGPELVAAWGANFENIVGAAGTAPGTWAASQPGAVISGLQGATIDLAVKSGKSGGSPRLSFKNIYNRQTSVEPQMTVQNVADLTLKNLESNSGENTLYDFDNDYNAHLDGSHNEFYIVTTNDHPMMTLFSSSIEVSNVDIQAHICPVGTACATAPANPEWQAFQYRGSVPGTLTVDNINLRQVYADSLGYCQTTGTWTAGNTALTLNTPSLANCPLGLAGLASGQSVVAQGIRPLTVVTVSAGPTYTLSLPPTDSGSSTTITFSTYTSYVASVGSGAVAPGSHIGGSTGFNAALLPGDASNNHFMSADNALWSNPCYVSKAASSTASPGSFFCPGVLSTGTGPTNGIPASDICSISLWYTGSGTPPASQYRELAICHDDGAGGLSGFNVYSSDNAVRGSESFVKIFSCDKAGNCASTAGMTSTVNTESTLLSAQAIGTDGAGKHKAVTVAGSGMLTLPAVATISGSTYIGLQSPPLPAAITLNSVQFTLSTIPLTCTTFAVVSLCSGNVSSTCYANTTLDGTHSGYAMTITTAVVPISTPLRLFVSTPASGCGTNAVSIGGVASYQ